MLLPLLGVIIGIVLGLLLRYSPMTYAVYVYCGLAALDSVFGDASKLEDNFESDIFISGFFGAFWQGWPMRVIGCPYIFGCYLRLWHKIIQILLPCADTF